MAARNGGIAQLGEHLPCKQGVESSNLSVSIVEGLEEILQGIDEKEKNRTLKTEYRKTIKYQRHPRSIRKDDQQVKDTCKSEGHLYL